MKSVIGSLGASRSTRRSATVRSCVFEAASASAMTSGLANLPVPMMSRDEKARPPSASSSVTVSLRTWFGCLSILRDITRFPAARVNGGEATRRSNGMAGFFLAERPPFRWISAIAGQGGTMAAQIDAVTEFQNAFKLLFQKRNWMVALPVVIGGVIAGIIGGVGFFVAFGS